MIKALVRLFPIFSLIMGAASILGMATILIVGLPSIQLYQIDPEPGLSAPTTQQARGREVYVSLGCVYCHSQQPRDASVGPDGARGWGRPSTPGDYVYDYPHQLGTMRTGPDLFNIGARQPSAQWHLVHVYNPRAVVDWSIMPSYPFLFEVKPEPEPGDLVVDVAAPFAPESGVVVAKPDAVALVDYLVGLDHTYPSAYLPRPEEDVDVDGGQ